MHTLWTSLVAIGLASANVHDQHDPPRLDNANHIFNAIHSSMRQWGSSLNHNGMSLFIATVPEGTELYHGTSKADRINGTQWLAFEPEHALVFARSRREPPGRGGPPGGPPRPEQELYDGKDRHPPGRAEDRSKFISFGHGEPGTEIKARRPHEASHDDRPLTHTAAQRERARMPQQKPLFSPEVESESEDEDHGYLHTYKPKHDLRLLYIDGQSAAKSSKGTLDTQDILLLHDYPPPKDDGDHRQPKNKDDKRKGPRSGGPMNEAWRAEKLCEMAERKWRGGVNGFLRMELGFEIILCSFERDLDVERITEADDGGMGGPPGHGDDGGSINYYRAVASRFDSIGGDRVKVNYDRFISLFASHEAITFDEDGFPRAVNDSDLLRSTQNDVKEMILHDDPKELIDWQAVADMVIARYSDRVEYLASGDLETMESFQAEVNRALRPFIDYSDRNHTTEIRRCARQYIPYHNDTDSLAAKAITNVTATLCASLSAAAASDDHAEAMAYIRNLKAWLAWTSWKKCRGCGYNEVCFVPIWPMGGKEEYEKPRCISNMSETSRGYWGDFGGPGRPHKNGSRRD
ncbi:hypothetical protein DOTSEDRAFT_74432 [Dothistroma septosporum NZE10]|uniref:Uncharacterized protein n=1 Tax=Dothistroma septosporum (strain NZE10 / CBS 128990) TaxID=675120 RepID=N1PE29_DOTSN|nr:hypothetical protein DOTSEDRAFT_74432 [Dothistroma septosporum NZE10]